MIQKSDGHSMLVSVIVTLYKDLDALKLILEALKEQTYKKFEVVVAEDCETVETQEFLASYVALNVVHVYHEDVGRTKTVIQNKAVCQSNGDYLIFIDGDMLPYTTFLEYQVKIAKPKQVMSGRRVNLDKMISQKVRNREVTAVAIEKNYFCYALKFMWEKKIRFEQGFSVNPDNFLYQQVLSKRPRNANIIGCNWSCYKEDFIAINGFDESYGLSCLGDDTDLDWRFRASGCVLVSSKNIANAFHLYHEDKREHYDATQELAWYKERQEANTFYCEHGMNKYCP